MKREPVSDNEQVGCRPWVRAADQVTLAILVTACFVAIGLHAWWHAARGHSLIEIDRAPPLVARFEVQLNEAPWPEFMLLPGIGETLARRIVAYRDQHGPFTSVDQLEHVKGIGPKTIRRIRPLLRVESPKRE